MFKKIKEWLKNIFKKAGNFVDDDEKLEKVTDVYVYLFDRDR